MLSKNVEIAALKVAIIGCGWLGSALATSLLAHQASVVATTTSVKKQKMLNQLGINTELLLLPALFTSLTNPKICAQKYWVICIPPQLKQGKKDYAEKIASLVGAAEQSGVERLILISTTALYGGLTGSIDENSALNSADEKVQALLAGENAAKQFSGKVSIVRFAGLVGKDRHPGKFLAGKTHLLDGNSRVNLIHQEDAVGIILAVLTHKNTVGVFNGVSETKASRTQFYQQAANNLNLPLPTFNEHQKGQPRNGKLICGDKIRDKLQYQFVYPNLLVWLKMI